MKHVRLTMRAPEAAVHPVFDMLTGADHVETVTGLHWNFSGDRLGILHYVEGDRDTYVEDLTAIDAVLDHDVAQAGEDAFYVYHRCVVDGGARELFETFSRGSLLLVPPIEFGDDGTATFSLYGESAEIQAAIEDVPDPVDLEVDAIGSMSDTPEVTDAALSERQREAVEAALAIGYYDVPRKASHEAVAEAIDCAPSTAAEHLRKGESKLLRSVLEG
jgi:predicted DNA binding protein